jgi:hypothetical protein
LTAFAVVFLACLAYAYAATVSMFRWYDDEGFVLLTLRQWLSGVPLYDGLYTEYGPFYYLAYGGLFRTAGVLPTHDAMRVLTLILWLSISTGFSYCVWAWTRSLGWALVTLVATLLVLRPLTGEAGHPQGLIWMMLTLVLLAALSRNANRATFFAVGALVGAVSLVKINVGIFLVMGLAAASVVGVTMDRWNRGWQLFNLVAAVAIPPLLMRQHLAEPGVLWRCALTIYGLGTTVFTLQERRAFTTSWSSLTAVIAGCIGSVAAIALATTWSGVSPAGLTTGVLWQPLQFSRAIPASPPNWVVLGFATACSVLSAVTLVRSRTRPSDGFVVAVRATVELGILVAVLLDPPSALVLALPMLWMLVPGKTEDTAAQGTRGEGVVVAIAAYGSLVAFPVAGTQSHLAASVIALAGFLSFARGSGAVPRQAALVVVACLSVIAGRDVLRLTQTPLASSELPGSRLLKLPPAPKETFLDIVSLALAHCQTLLTYPGMNSFHIWTGLPHPTGFATSAAMVLFDAKEQAAVARKLVESPRPCVIYNPDLARWTARYRRPFYAKPLESLVLHQFQSVYSRAGYEIRVPAPDVRSWQRDH